MRVLVLDDDDNRLATFKMRFAGDELTTVKTAEDAILTLSVKPKFTCVYLDHDLGETCTTGLAVARHIAVMEHSKRPALVIVHSHNHYRAREMAMTLADAGVHVRLEPFSMSSTEQTMMSRYATFMGP